MTAQVRIFCDGCWKEMGGGAEAHMVLKDPGDGITVRPRVWHFHNMLCLKLRADEWPWPKDTRTPEGVWKPKREGSPPPVPPDPWAAVLD